MGIMQKIRSVLLPEIGIKFEPEFVEESEVSTDFTRSLAHVVGRTGNRSILIGATPDGRLHVAAAGTSMEVYLVESGDAPVDYDDDSTFEQVNAIYVTDFLIEKADATIQFRNALGNWGDSISLLVGFFSKDLIHYGVRIQRRAAGVAAYEITMYR